MRRVGPVLEVAQSLSRRARVVWLFLIVATAAVLVSSLRSSPSPAALTKPQRCANFSVGSHTYVAYRWSRSVSCTTARRVLGALAADAGDSRPGDWAFDRYLVYAGWTCSAQPGADQMCGRSQNEVRQGRWLFCRPACIPGRGCPAARER